MDQTLPVLGWAIYLKTGGGTLLPVKWSIASAESRVEPGAATAENIITVENPNPVGGTLVVTPPSTLPAGVDSIQPITPPPILANDSIQFGVIADLDASSLSETDPALVLLNGTASMGGASAP